MKNLLIASLEKYGSLLFIIGYLVWAVFLYGTMGILGKKMFIDNSDMKEINLNNTESTFMKGGVTGFWILVLTGLSISVYKVATIGNLKIN